MCGRYAASRKPGELAEIFGVGTWDPAEAPAPNWNVAPTADVHAVLERPDRQLRTMRWGLVPPWAKSLGAGAKMINARSETVHEKAAYRRAFAARRCLLPADGYYEWATAGKRKQPYFVTPVDGSVMAMAGLYEFWRDPTLPEDHPRSRWTTCTVLTAEAESAPLPGADPGGPRSLADIHPRMPLTLPPDRWDAWLDPATEPDFVRRLLNPPPPGLMRAHPVSPEVGNVRNNGAHLLDPLPPPEDQALF